MTIQGPLFALRLFLDGSCLEPQCARLRVATWAVCYADLGPGEFFPLSHGAVCGGLQTILRGEICVAISACTVSKKQARPFTCSFTLGSLHSSVAPMTQWADPRRIMTCGKSWPPLCGVPGTLSRFHFIRMTNVMGKLLKNGQSEAMGRCCSST